MREFTIKAHAEDKAGRIGTKQISTTYKKRFDLGIKDFTVYDIFIEDVKNIARTEATNSFTTKSGDNTIGVWANIYPERMESVLSSYVRWNVTGINEVSGNPNPPFAGNPSRFYVEIPPISAMPAGRTMPMAYEVVPTLV